MDVKKLRGMAVVSIRDGEQVGTIDDVLVDLDARAIAAMVVRAAGSAGGGIGVVDMGAVRAIGHDAVMIADRSAVTADRADQRRATFPNLGQITSLRVVTDRGTVAGGVATVHVDDRTGQLSDVEVVPSGFLGPWRHHRVVPIAQVTSIGRDVVVIPDALLRASETQDQPVRPRERPPSDSERR